MEVCFKFFDWQKSNWETDVALYSKIRQSPFENDRHSAVMIITTVVWKVHLIMEHCWSYSLKLSSPNGFRGSVWTSSDGYLKHLIQYADETKKTNAKKSLLFVHKLLQEISHHNVRTFHSSHTADSECVKVNMIIFIVFPVSLEQG